METKTYIKPQIKWTSDKIKFLRDNYPTRGSAPIVKKLGIRRSAVKAMARRLGISCIKDKNLYKLKILNQETPMAYYWLGFMVADGYIDKEGEMKFLLSIKDISHLRKLSKLLNVKIHSKKIRTEYGFTECCYLSCKDAKHGILIKNKLNITEKKTINPPSLIFLNTKEKLLSFFAGFIDGDGMIGYRQKRPYMLRIMCHSSWKKNLIFFKNALLKLFNLNITVSNTTKGYSYLSICNQADIFLLKTEFAKLNIPLMKRKWGGVKLKNLSNHKNTKKIHE